MPKPHILTLEQMRVLASPVRQRIIAVLYARGESSIADIAEEMERKPDTLYHHIRVMLRSGLVVQTGDRAAGKNREAIYGPTAPRLAADSASHEPAYMREFARMIRNNLADAAANHARAYQDRKKRGLVLFETVNVRLTEPMVEELNQDIRALFEKAKSKSDPAGSRHFFVFLSTPVGKK